MLMVNYKPLAFLGHEDTKPQIFWGHDITISWGLHISLTVQDRCMVTMDHQ